MSVLNAFHTPLYPAVICHGKQAGRDASVQHSTPCMLSQKASIPRTFMPGSDPGCAVQLYCLVISRQAVSPAALLATIAAGSLPNYPLLTCRLSCLHPTRMLAEPPTVSASPFASQAVGTMTDLPSTSGAAPANGLAMPSGYSNGDMGQYLWHQPSSDAVTRAGDILGMPHLDGYTAKVSPMRINMPKPKLPLHLTL